MQDGLRLFVAGNPASPVRDVVPGDDPEDSGQKGISYRTEPVHPRPARGPEPRTPTVEVPATPAVAAAGRRLGQAAQPHVHGARPGVEVRALAGVGRDRGRERSGLTAATVHDLVLGAGAPGDHAYRSGAFRWAVESGVWGVIRVE